MAGVLFLGSIGKCMNMPASSISPQRALALLTAAIALTALVYIPGLSGPYLLDDPPNLAALQRWWRGKDSLESALFGNGAWYTQRAFAIASFALNAQLVGFHPLGFKVGNLVIHLACGATAYLLLRKILRRDPHLDTRARTAALIIVAVWLLHPLHVSTVLYIIQRMAQLSALTCIAGLLLYVHLREKLEKDSSAAAWIGIYIGIPFFVLLGVQAKQNAVILPALCFVIENVYFRRVQQWSLQLKTFYSAILFAPLAVATIGLAIKWDWLLNSYGEYPFTLTQRLLTESRVLWHYIFMLVSPNPVKMGIYTDDFIVSRNLIDPISTAIALAGLVIASTMAMRVRNRHPSICAGWFIFLISHSVEGSILPLDIYFEHRNYLPSLGLFLCAAGLVSSAMTSLDKRGIRSRRIGLVTITAIFAVLALQTHGRARVWSDAYVLNQTALRAHPDSPRAVVNNIGMMAISGRYEAAYSIANSAMAPERRSGTRRIARLTRVIVDCYAQQSASASELIAAARELPTFIDITTFQVFSRILERIRANPTCEGITELDLAHAAAIAADNATDQADGSWPKWRLRFLAAVLYGNNNEWELALPQAKLSWQPFTNGERAWILLESLRRSGKRADAEVVYKEAMSRIDTNDPNSQPHIERLARIMRSFSATTSDRPGN